MSTPRLPNRLRRLSRLEIVADGDIVIHDDGSLGGTVAKSEIGMTVAKTGYAGVASYRPASRKNKPMTR